MTEPSPVIVETLIRSHGCLVRTAGRCGVCGRQALDLAEAGVLGPEQVREKQADAYDKAVARVCQMTGTSRFGWRNPYSEGGR